MLLTAVSLLALGLAVALVLLLVNRHKWLCEKCGTPAPCPLCPSCPSCPPERVCPAVMPVTCPPARKCPPCGGGAACMLPYAVPKDPRVATILRGVSSALGVVRASTCRVFRAEWRKGRSRFVQRVNTQERWSCTAAALDKIDVELSGLLTMAKEYAARQTDYDITETEARSIISAVSSVIRATSDAVCRNGRPDGEAAARLVDDTLAAMCELA